MRGELGGEGNAWMFFFLLTYGKTSEDRPTSSTTNVDQAIIQPTIIGSGTLSFIPVPSSHQHTSI